MLEEPRQELVVALAGGVRVRDAMRREFVTTEPGEMLQTAFARLIDGGSHTIPVVQRGRLRGLLTADNLAEVLMIQEALREARRMTRRRGGATCQGGHLPGTCKSFRVWPLAAMTVRDQMTLQRSKEIKIRGDSD